MDLLISAFRANAFRVTKPAGLAKHDALGSTFLLGGHRVMIAVGQIMDVRARYRDGIVTRIQSRMHGVVFPFPQDIQNIFHI